MPLDVADEAGWTPLIISSSVGNNDLVKLLLEHGCNPNNVTEMKTSCLHYACSKNRIEVVKLSFLRFKVAFKIIYFSFLDCQNFIR